MNDVWGKLWDIATSEPGDPAAISVDAEDSGLVVLTWPDGSKGAFAWDAGEWRHVESLNGCPGDVAARDAL